MYMYVACCVHVHACTCTVAFMLLTTNHLHMHALQLSMFSSAVAEQVLDHCIVESADNDVHEDTNYSVVYNYEFLEDVHEGSGST